MSKKPNNLLWVGLIVGGALLFILVGRRRHHHEKVVVAKPSYKVEACDDHKYYVKQEDCDQPHHDDDCDHSHTVSVSVPVSVPVELDIPRPDTVQVHVPINASAQQPKPVDVVLPVSVTAPIAANLAIETPITPGPISVHNLCPCEEKMTTVDCQNHLKSCIPQPKAKCWTKCIDKGCHFNQFHHEGCLVCLKDCCES